MSSQELGGPNGNASISNETTTVENGVPTPGASNLSMQGVTSQQSVNRTASERTVQSVASQSGSGRRASNNDLANNNPTAPGSRTNLLPPKFPQSYCIKGCRYHDMSDEELDAGESNFFLNP